ncbi:histidine phosphatase family protein [Actinomarinicola tropica]|uniref:Histidine phosphatase family protein n=1 Tax=Actinomarinicola tropica TaxID=2789776 RepID=A0A5Q2RL08_9ACTN|nr:histidine phosphatase family protein [Actinomarinicola tropica]QGG95612.1 histidine phosphatase family protein [Actinomarinicola tropica]
MLVVVRHGRTADNAAGLLLGRADPDIDAVGEEQATALAAWIGPVDRVVSSPLLRARRTAEAFGLEVEVDERWIELDYGELDRRPPTEIAAEVWSHWRHDPDWAPPGGESMRSLDVRVAAAADELLPEAATATIVVVTHVSPIKSVLSWAVGGIPQVGFRTRVGQPSVTRIAVGRDGPVLHSFNESPPNG